MVQVELIKDVDIGEIPRTPAMPIIDDDLTPVATKSLKVAGLSHGFPISYIQEQEGRLIQNILPVHKTESQQISTSSKIELHLHTETAFHPYKPTYVLLLCLRGDKGAITTYSLAEDILSELTDNEISILQQPWFITSIDDSFRTKGEPDMELITQILRFPSSPSDIEFTFDWALMRGTNDDATMALSSVRSAIAKTTREIILEAGDLLVINNKRAVHGRKSFQARYDGSDRWVKRLLTISPLPPKTYRNGHVINLRFPAK